MSLSQKQQKFARLVALLIQQANHQGFEVTLGEAYRPPEMAQIYAQDDRGIPNSLHTSRLAIDLNLFLNGRYLTQTEDYRPLGEWWVLQDPDCRWGGHFQSRADGSHFSLTHGGVS